MCGRFTLATPPEILAALFELDDLGDWNDPRYNVAPQTRILTVRRGPKSRVAQSLIWGAVNPRASRPLINARSETAPTSPLFGPAFAGARILVPADGFFEWTKAAGGRQAHYFQQPGGRPFAFAGLALSPAPGAEKDDPAAVILTTEASESVRAIHNRMPLIVSPEWFETWLNPTAPTTAALAVLKAGAGTPWTSRTVGPMVNSVRNDSPACIEAAAPLTPRQSSLF